MRLSGRRKMTLLNMRLPSVPPSPGHGGFAGSHKKDQNRYQPYSTGWKGQDSAKAAGNSGEDMPAWKSFGGRGRPRGRGRRGPANHGSPGSKDVNQYKWQLLCQNTGIRKPVCSGSTRNSRNFQSSDKCKLLCCQSCTFCSKKCKAAAKERLKSSIKETSRNKICELCFFCRSVCFCPICSQCPVLFMLH